MNSEKVVSDFCAAWSRSDIDAIMDAFSDNATYHNIPMEAYTGKEAIQTFIDGFMATIEGPISFEIKHQVASKNLVFNERIDSFVMGGNKIAAPVCGVFEITDDGKISAWRDYFDMGDFTGDS